MARYADSRGLERATSVAAVLAATLVLGPGLRLWAAEPVLGAATPAARSSPAAAGPEGGFLAQLSPASSKEPIVIVADRLEFDYDKNRVTYRGKVRATQGDLTIDSDNLTVTLDRTEGQKQVGLREVIAEGHVVITQGTRRATGATAVFSQPARTIVLLGDPVLRDGRNEVTGERLVVFLDEGRSVVESSAKRRVSATLYPGSDSGDLAAATSPTGGKPAEGVRP